MQFAWRRRNTLPHRAHRRQPQPLLLHHQIQRLGIRLDVIEYREIADIVALPLGTVKTQIYRARTTLALRLASLAAEQGIIPANKNSQEIDPPR